METNTTDNIVNNQTILRNVLIKRLSNGFKALSNIEDDEEGTIKSSIFVHNDINYYKLFPTDYLDKYSQALADEKIEKHNNPDEDASIKQIEEDLARIERMINFAEDLSGKLKTQSLDLECVSTYFSNNKVDVEDISLYIDSTLADEVLGIKSPLMSLETIYSSTKNSLETLKTTILAKKVAHNIIFDTPGNGVAEATENALNDLFDLLSDVCTKLTDFSPADMISGVYEGLENYSESLKTLSDKIDKVVPSTSESQAISRLSNISHDYSLFIEFLLNEAEANLNSLGIELSEESEVKQKFDSIRITLEDINRVN